MSNIIHHVFRTIWSLYSFLSHWFFITGNHIEIVQMLLEHSKVSSVFTPIVLHEKKSLINAMEQLILIPLGWPCGGPKGCHDSKSQGQERCNANSHAERSQGINAHGRPLRHLPSSPLLLPLDLSLWSHLPTLFSHLHFFCRLDMMNSACLPICHGN